MEIAVAKLLAEPVGPGFEVGGVYLDRGAAVTTGQVVVVRVNDAAPIEALAPIGHHDVDLARRRERLQLGVDRRERDLAPVAGDEGVEFLRADEALEVTQGPDDLTALGGVASCAHGFSVPVST